MKCKPNFCFLFLSFWLDDTVCSTELNYKPWNSHCAFTQCKSKLARVLERERNKFGYSQRRIFYGTFTFFSTNSRNTHFFEKYVRIKIPEHKIFVLMSKPLNSTIKTGMRTRTTYLPSECVRNIRKRGKYICG